MFIISVYFADGTGMTGRILFAYYQGTSLDSNSKMWRLYADVLNDFSFLVDLVTPFFARQYSIYFISFAGLLRVKANFESFFAEPIQILYLYNFFIQNLVYCRHLRWSDEVCFNATSSNLQ